MRTIVRSHPVPEPTPPPAVPTLTSVAFLPPGPLGEVWLYLAVNARKLESFGTRVGIPISGVPDGLACTRDEFLEALNLFHNADVLDLVGVSGGNKNAFVLKIHPDSIHIVEIEKIVEREVPTTWLEIANRVRSEIPNSRLAAKTARGYISEWIEKNYPDLNGNTGVAKVMGYLPNSNRLDYSWGYLYKPEGGDTYLKCLHGFEPIRLIPTDAPAVRYRTKGSLPPAAPASPAPAVVVPAPVPTAPVPPSDDVLRLAHTLAAGSLDSTLAQLDENIARLVRTRELVGQLATERMEFEKHRHAADASEARIAQIREELKTLGY